jgi:dTDP-4-dehydrorhamnose reductase
LVLGRSADGRRGALDGLLAALREGRPTHLFVDEFRRPVDLRHLVDVTVRVLDDPVRGLLHVAGADRVSRLELGRAVCRAWGLDPAPLVEARLADWSGPPRPADLDLDAGRLTRRLGMPPTPLGEALGRMASEE